MGTKKGSSTDEIERLRKTLEKEGFSVLAVIPIGTPFAFDVSRVTVTEIQTPKETEKSKPKKK